MDIKSHLKKYHVNIETTLDFLNPLLVGNENTQFVIDKKVYEYILENFERTFVYY